MQTTSNPEPRVAVQPGSQEPFQADLERRLGWQRWYLRSRLLWGHRRLLWRSGVAGLVIGAIVAFLIPSRYESTTRLMPPESQSASTLALVAGLAGGQTAGAAGGGSGSSLGALAGDLLGIKSTGELFIGVMRSRTVQDAIIQKFDLKKVYGVAYEMSARKKLLEKTTINEDRKSGIITVTITDHDSKRAAAIAGAYVSELDTLMADLTTSSAHRERVFLEGRLNGVRQELETAEKNFSQFASKSGTIDVNEQGKAIVESGAMLQGQLIAAESELEGLKQIYNDNNVRVRSTQARVSELRSQLQKMAGKGEAGPSGNTNASDEPYPTLRELPLLGVTYADLFRQLKVEETVFEVLTKEYELAKVQEAKEIPTVKVLDAPDVPERKSFPPRFLVMVLGVLCTSMLAVIWILGCAGWQRIDPQHPGKLLVHQAFAAIRTEIPWNFRNGFHHEEAPRRTDDRHNEPGV